jgi:hypothetical protein
MTRNSYNSYMCNPDFAGQRRAANLTIVDERSPTLQSSLTAQKVVICSEVILGPHSPGCKFDSRCAIRLIGNPLRRIKSVDAVEIP